VTRTPVTREYKSRTFKFDVEVAYITAVTEIAALRSKVKVTGYKKFCRKMRRNQRTKDRMVNKHGKTIIVLHCTCTVMAFMALCYLRGGLHFLDALCIVLLKSWFATFGGRNISRSGLSRFWLISCASPAITMTTHIVTVFTDCRIHPLESR